MQLKRVLEQEENTLSFFQSINLGIRVLLSEIKWYILKGLRYWEIKQLSRRLEREYQLLGKYQNQKETGEAGENIDSEIELCSRQIDFLQKEIDFLQAELQKLRENMLDLRRKKWNL